MGIDTTPNKLLINRKEWLYFFFLIIIIFLINLTYEYISYKKLTKYEVSNIDTKVINIYPKKDYYILKLQSSEFSFYTSNSNNTQQIKKFDHINIDIITKNITFYSYLKGFFTNSFNIEKYPTFTPSIFERVSSNISSQHENTMVSELFNALFLGIPISKELRDRCVDFGVSHLIAISGFHLGVLAFIVYWMFYFPYKYIHTKYLPYRNIRYDTLIVTSVVLLGYLLFLGMIPSLLRAIVMYIFAIFLYRNNIRLISFSTLFIILVMIIAFFPKLMFSLSLWLSIFGVFYIFLFIQYFSHLSKTTQFIIFNIWLFMVLNPIIHQFFNIGSLHQIYSVLFTIGFTLFYPLELFLHLIGQGSLLDPLINMWLSIKPTTFETTSSVYFTLFYIVLSLYSIVSRKAFWLLNIVFILFNGYIFKLS